MGLLPREIYIMLSFGRLAIHMYIRERNELVTEADYDTYIWLEQAVLQTRSSSFTRAWERSISHDCLSRHTGFTSCVSASCSMVSYSSYRRNCPPWWLQCQDWKQMFSTCLGGAETEVLPSDLSSLVVWNYVHPNCDLLCFRRHAEKEWVDDKRTFSMMYLIRLFSNSVQRTSTCILDSSMTFVGILQTQQLWQTWILFPLIKRSC